MNLPRLKLFSRFFILFGASTILLAFCIAIGVLIMSEEDAIQFVKEKHDGLYKTLSGALAGPVDLAILKEKIKGPKADVVIVRGDERISTSDNFPDITVLMPIAVKIKSLYFAKYHSKYYLFVKDKNDWIAATSLIPNLLVYPAWLTPWPWILAIIIFYVSYIILRRLLRPIADATQAALMVSQGVFTYRIDQHPNSELADLTHGLNKMTADLQQLFDAKNDLLLAVSHELRTPLARMNVSLAMLEQSSVAEDLKNDVRHMDALIEQLLEGERLQSGHNVLHLSSYYAPMLVEEVLKEEGILHKVELKGCVPEQVLNIDVGRFKFLLRNLMKNALEHAKEAPQVTLVVKQTSEQLHFIVEDNGSGIGKETLTRIFDPFYCVENTTHRNTKGTGLGLFLCKRIALAHNGELEVKSILGKGSKFSVTLPITND